MKNDLLKKSLPHVIAIVVFLIIAIFYCKPAIEGSVLSQHDIIGWKGMAQNAFEYKAKTGHFPLWSPNLFSGMPNYQIAMEGKSILPDTIKILTLWLPRPINFFFLACVCFYILCMVLRTRAIVGIFASIAFAYSTYNSVIIFAGHESQMLATSFVPLVLAGLVSTYEKKYWLGLALTTFGAYHQIVVNHLQISYYFFLIALAVTIGYLVVWIRNKEWKHIAIAGGITVGATIVALMASSLSLMTAAEYAKYTMRGGKSVSVEGDTVKSAKTSGLDTGYAFAYSVYKSETSTLMMPNAFGGGSHLRMDEGSHVVKKLTTLGIPEQQAGQVAQNMPKYWGGLPYTAGPAYLGAVLCIIGILGFVLVKTPLRWGLLAVTVFGVLMSWGRYLPGFNTFLFEHLPLYNKFRAPSMAQVIPQITVCIMAALALQQILFVSNSREWLKANFKKVLFAVGGVSLLLILLYLANDYVSAVDSQIRQSINQQAQNEEVGRAVINGLKEDRQAMFGGQLLRTIAFIVFVTGLLYAFVRNLLKPMVIAATITVVSSIELLMVSKDYLTEESYVSPDELESQNFLPDQVDQEILKDKDPDYRVLNLAADTWQEARTSYFHKSVGGYHPAKLRIYQDLVDKYLSGRPDPGVLNMLNVKYVIIPNQQTNQPMLAPNPDAFGPVWFVKHINVVDGPVAELVGIGKTDLRDTAVVDKSFGAAIGTPQADTTATIKLTKFDNDAIDYESNSATQQFAVFSEVYYPAGWNAYIDGKRVDYVRANYVLRGLSIPAGKHAVRFVFEPATYKKAVSISFIGSILVVLLFIGGLVMAFRKKKAAATNGSMA